MILQMSEKILKDTRTCYRNMQEASSIEDNRRMVCVTLQIRLCRKNFQTEEINKKKSPQFYLINSTLHKQ